MQDLILSLMFLFLNECKSILPENAISINALFKTTLFLRIKAKNKIIPLSLFTRKTHILAKNKEFFYSNLNNISSIYFFKRK